MPAWWPPRLRGTLSIIEFEGHGEYRSDALPPGLEPYGANMVVHLPAAARGRRFRPAQRTHWERAVVG